MATSIVVIVVFALPPKGTYSVSFWFSAIARLFYLLSFFRFFFWKKQAKLGKRDSRRYGNIYM